MTTTRIESVAMTIATALLMVVCETARAQDEDATLDRIFADWEVRRERMQAVEFRFEGTMTRAQGIDSLMAQGLLSEDCPNPMPPEDYSYPLELNLLLDFSANRIRTERRDQTFHATDCLYFPRHKTWLYDGDAVQRLSPREGNTGMGHEPPEYQPELHLLETRHLSFLIDFSYEVAFLACGRFPRFHGTTPGFQRFTLPLHREIFHVHGRGAFANRDCVILRTESSSASAEAFFEYWVDTARESAVLRCLRYHNGIVLDRLEIEYDETEQGWMPSQLVRTKMWDAEQWTFREELSVQSVTADPPLDDSMFHVEPEPGMIVTNTATGETYVWNGPGDTINVKEHHRQALLREAEGPRTAFWIAGGVVLATLAAIAIWWRSRAA